MTVGATVGWGVAEGSGVFVGSAMSVIDTMVATLSARGVGVVVGSAVGASTTTATGTGLGCGRVSGGFS